MNFLHSLKALLGGLLSFLGVIGVVYGGLEPASNIVRILVALRLANRFEVARIKNLWG